MIQLPSTCFAEDEGSLTNSGRWLQWHWAAATPPGEAKHDTWIMAQIFLRLKALYQKEGGAFPDPILNLIWPYKDPGDPTPDELAKEINGYGARGRSPIPADPTKVCWRRASSCASFAALRDDGTTACGCWIYSGCYTEAGNRWRGATTPIRTRPGPSPKWAWSWPVNRRILYNRASARPAGQALGSEPQAASSGTARSGRATTCRTSRPTAKPERGRPVHHEPGGHGAPVRPRAMMRDGPFPEHYEPFEAPIANL